MCVRHDRLLTARNSICKPALSCQAHFFMLYMARVFIICGIYKPHIYNAQKKK